nr:e3 ubiquitin-protein ligase [Quercus suber]
MEDALAEDDLFEDFLNSPFKRPLTPAVASLLGNGCASMSKDAPFLETDRDFAYMSADVDPVSKAGLLHAALPSPNVDLVAVDRAVALVTASSEEFTSAHCLDRVLEIFPDISHEYVRMLYDNYAENGDYETLPGPARFDNILEQLLESGVYPKQETAARQRKRKRESSSSIDDSEWTRADRHVVTGTHHINLVQTLLKTEFPEIPVAYINGQLSLHKHVYQTFIALAHARDTFDPNRPAFSRGRPSAKRISTADATVGSSGMAAVMAELEAAQKHVRRTRAQRAAEQATKHAELENARQAKDAGDVVECSACFDELPLNRQIRCEATTPHFTCFDCATRYVSSEVGQARCRVLCTAGCGAGFAPCQINLLADKPLLAKLAELEQQKAIRDAGLEDLEGCPFCDFQAEMPPIEENFEFRCMNPECEKVSCRRCRLTSHIPLSCSKYKESLAKDNQLNAIHKIEEAMTEALMRSCNKCKTRFIKEHGCNKMTCPTCSNLQCYVCSTTLKNYDHFDSGGTGEQPSGSTKTKKCPLFDNVEERHANEVKKAEAVAKAMIVEQIPDINPNDLDIKMSDAVVAAELDRIKKAGVNGRGVPPPAPYRPLFNDDFNPVFRPRAAVRMPEEEFADAMAAFRPQFGRLRRLQRGIGFDEDGDAGRIEAIDPARAHIAQRRLHQRQGPPPRALNAANLNPILANHADRANVVDGRRQPRIELPRALPVALAPERYGALIENHRQAPPIPMHFPQRPNPGGNPARMTGLGLPLERMRHAHFANLYDPILVRAAAQHGPQERMTQGHRPRH